MLSVAFDREPRDFYQAARRRLRPDGILVANFAGPQQCGSAHFALLDEVFAGRPGTVSGGDNHIAFAFADSGYPPDWARQEERAGALAEEFPLDFTAIVKRLREGAGRGRQ